MAPGSEGCKQLVTLSPHDFQLRQTHNGGSTLCTRGLKLLLAADRGASNMIRPGQAEVWGQLDCPLAELLACLLQMVVNMPVGLD